MNESNLYVFKKYGTYSKNRNDIGYEIQEFEILYEDEADIIIKALDKNGDFFPFQNTKCFVLNNKFNIITKSQTLNDYKRINNENDRILVTNDKTELERYIETFCKTEVKNVE